MTTVQFDPNSPIESIQEFRRNYKEHPSKLSFLHVVSEFFRQKAIANESLEVPEEQKRKFAKKDMAFLSEHVSERDAFIANVQKVTNLHFHRLDPQVFQLDVKNDTPVFLSGEFVPQTSPLLQNVPEDSKGKGYTREFTLGLRSSNPKLIGVLKDLNDILTDKKLQLGDVCLSYLYCMKDFIHISTQGRAQIDLKKMDPNNLFAIFHFSKEIGAEKRTKKIKNEIIRRLTI